MYEFLTATPNLLFTSALVLVLTIGLIELISLMGGIGLFDFLDGAFSGGGDALGGDVEVKSSIPIADALLGWLKLGRVPAIIAMLAFLFLFGAIGLKLQAFAGSLFGSSLPVVAAAPIVLLAVLLPLRWLIGLLSLIIPRDETAAVSPESFIGRVATIMIGEASSGKPAEAKLIGPLGRTHYVMVEPDVPGESFSQGSQVLIVARKPAFFTVIAINNSNLKV
jgi:hypothetical protein